MLRHPNVLKFIRIVIGKTENMLWLVTELMDTDLSSVMHTLTYDESVRIARDVAVGM